MSQPLTLLSGDCREVMKSLPAASVNCCVTSPPYWGLRDYGTASWEGGDEACDHRNARPGAGGDCGKCGARRIDQQIGLEPTPEHYVETLVQVFKQVWRVLRNDGTLWLNLGDSYARAPEKGGSGTPNGRNTPEMGYGLAQSAKVGSSDGMMGRGDRPGTRARIAGMKPKDLIGIPWRVAFALQADGWYLRSDIIWHKPNPMPESVTDRPTKSHEYVFLLAKAERYYYDADAIKEKSVDPNGSADRYESAFGGAKARAPVGDAGIDTRTRPQGMREFDGTRNKRDVWTVPTAPYKEAHFATFPPDLVKPCILAGCPVGGLVLDPFAGSGTTGKVALELGRRAVLIELNPAYLKLSDERCRTTLGFPFP